MKPFPHLKQWIDRIAARPAVQRGIGAKYNRDAAETFSGVTHL